MPDLLAQAAIDSSIVSLVGNGVTAAVLAWYVIYDVRVRTPNMLAAFSKEQAELRQTFTAEQGKERESNRQMVEAIRQTFVTEQGAARQAFLTEQGASRQAFTAEQVAMRSQHEQEQAKLRQMLLDNMMNMRQAVHDVKNTAEALMGDKRLKEVEAGR